jgi:hypothetical protein
MRFVILSLFPACHEVQCNSFELDVQQGRDYVGLVPRDRMPPLGGQKSVNHFVGRDHFRENGVRWEA